MVSVLLAIRAVVNGVATWFRETAIKVDVVPILTAPLSGFFWGVASLLQEIIAALGQVASFWEFLEATLTNFFTKTEVIELTDYTKDILSQDIDILRAKLDMTEEEFREFLLPKLTALEINFNLFDTTVKIEIADLVVRQELTEAEYDKLKADTSAYDSYLRTMIETLENEFRENTNWFEEAKLFFTDPAQFIFNRIEEILVRFW